MTYQISAHQSTPASCCRLDPPQPVAWTHGFPETITHPTPPPQDSNQSIASSLPESANDTCVSEFTAWSKTITTMLNTKLDEENEQTNEQFKQQNNQLQELTKEIKSTTETSAECMNKMDQEMTNTK